MTQVAVIDQVRDAITKMTPQFKAALPTHVSPEKFVRVVMTAIQMTPALLEADRRTLFSAAMRASQMGLLPDGREGAIVTFGKQCQFMPMMGGILKMLRNSGELASIDAQLVHQNDKFTYRPGFDLVPLHEPDWFGDRGAVIGVYCVAKMKDGAAYVEVMSKAQVEKVREVSRSKGNGPWVQWWDEMARKTVVRRLAKRLPMSTDMDPSLMADDEFAPSQAYTPPAAPEAPAEQPRRRGASRLDAVAQAGDYTDVEVNEPPADTPPADTVQHDDDSPI